MKTAIAAAAVARLNWIASQLATVNDNYWVRPEGEHVFKAMRQELDDIIANAVEPVTVYNPPAIVQEVMTSEQVETLVDRVVAAIPAATDPDVIVTAIKGALESTELAVVDAIAQTRADVLAAIPAPAPATTE